MGILSSVTKQTHVKSDVISDDVSDVKSRVKPDVKSDGNRFDAIDVISSQMSGYSDFSSHNPTFKK